MRPNLEHRLRRTPLVLALVLLATALVGCGETRPTTATPSATPAAHGPQRLQPAHRPSAGTRRVTCVLRTDHGRRRVALDLPRAYRDGLPRGWRNKAGCGWHRPLVIPTGDDNDGDPATTDTYRSDTVLSINTVRAPLQRLYDEQEPDAVEGDTPDGDDSVLHLRLEHDVPVFGATVGDRLTYLCYCDGQNLPYRFAQADGVRVYLQTEQPVVQRTDRDLRAILASIGTVR